MTPVQFILTFTIGVILGLWLPTTHTPRSEALPLVWHDPEPMDPAILESGGYFYDCPDLAGGPSTVVTCRLKQRKAHK